MNRHPTEAMRLAAEALRPLANAVFNDNGDMTVSIPIVSAEDCIAAYFATKRLSSALAVEARPTEAQIEERANQAADAVGVTTYSDMRPFVVQAVKYALSPTPVGEWHCPKCGAQADERYDCCETYALTPASSAVEEEAAYWVAETRMGLVPAAAYQPHAIPLYRHPAPASAGEWRTIDSAPKDQMVLVVDVNWPAALQRDDPPPIRVGYLCTSMLKWHIFGASWTPTHWMPLPASPTLHQEID